MPTFFQDQNLLDGYIGSDRQEHMYYDIEVTSWGKGTYEKYLWKTPCGKKNLTFTLSLFSDKQSECSLK